MSGLRGRVKFTCLECKTGWMPRRHEWGRAAGLSCPACGSRFWQESKMSRKEKKLGVVKDATGVSDATRRMSGRDDL